MRAFSLFGCGPAALVLRLAILAGAAALIGCGAGESTDPRPADNETAAAPSAKTLINEPPSSTPSPGSSVAAPPPRVAPEVVIETSLGDIRVKLNYEKAPATVDNFLHNYVDRGFYDDTIFHYVEAGFMIAGGGYTPDFKAKETRAETVNEASNGLKNVRGTIAMARHADYIHSATSQFFINLADNHDLDHDPDAEDEKFGYCVFGEVTQGMDVVDKIAAVGVSDRDGFPKCPVESVVVRSIRRAD